MERLGKPRHRREGRSLSERDASESNLWIHDLSRSPERKPRGFVPLSMTMGQETGNGP
jgi:hypothetical protein